MTASTPDTLNSGDVSLAPGKFIVAVVNMVMLPAPKVDKSIVAASSISIHGAPGINPATDDGL